LLHSYLKVSLSVMPNFVWKIYLSLFDRNYRKAKKYFKSQIQALIKTAQIEKLQVEQGFLKENDRKSGIIIQTLVDAFGINPQTDFSEEEIAGECGILIVGGSETTSAALAWVIYFLCTRPEVQARLKLEMQQHNCPRDIDSITYKDIDNLEYLNCVVEETLRLAPLITGTLRTVNEDNVFVGKVGPLIKGDNVEIGIYNMNTDPNLWKIDPNDWNPDRFYTNGGIEQAVDGNCHPVLKKTAFGGGQRACIGMHLAKFDFKVVLYRLMQHVTFIASEDHKPNTFRQSIAITPGNLSVYIKHDSV